MEGKTRKNKGLPFSNTTARAAAAVFLAPLLISTTAHSATDAGALAETFFKEPKYEQVSISPDGSHLAYFTRSKGGRALNTFEFATGKFRFIKGMPTQQEYRYAWLDNDNLIVAFDRPGTGGITVASVDENLTETEVLMEDKVARLLQAAPVRAKEAYVVSQSGGNRFPDLLKVGPEFKVPVVVEENPGDVIQWVLDANGRVTGSVARTNDGSTVYRFRRESGADWERLVLPNGSTPLFLSANGELLFSTHVDDGGASVVSIFSLKEKRLMGKPYSHPEYDIISPFTEYIANQADGSIVGFIHYTETPNVVQFSGPHRKVQGQVNALLPSTLNRVLGYAANGMLVVESESDVVPKTCNFVHLEEGSVTPFFSSRPWIEVTQTSQMMLVKFPSRDGTDLHGYLTLAPSKKKNKPGPMIVKVHGGPRERDTWGFDPETQFFVRLGFSVLQVNYRGSVGYGRNYVPESFLDTCRFAVEDVADGVRWAVAQGYADPKRVAILGGGFGAFAAFAGAAFEPKLYRCVVGYAGIYDWQLPMSDPDRRMLTRQVSWGGNFQREIRSNRDGFRVYSPVYAAGSIRAAALLFHPGDDAFALKKQAMTLRSALRSAGKTHELSVNLHGMHGGSAGAGGGQRSQLNVLSEMGGYTDDDAMELSGMIARGRGGQGPGGGAGIPPLENEKKRVEFYTSVAAFLEDNL